MGTWTVTGEQGGTQMPAANFPWSLGARGQGRDSHGGKREAGQSLESEHVAAGVRSHTWAGWTNRAMLFPTVCAGPEAVSLPMPGHLSR